MTEVVIPLVTALVGILAFLVFNTARLRFERRARRLTLTAALVSEATTLGASLWRLLHEHPKSDNTAPNNDRFYRAVAGFQRAGDVFLAHLPSADVMEPQVVRKLADVYAGLRAAALEATRLAEVGSVQTPRGITWALKDRLARIVGELREAISQLEEWVSGRQPSMTLRISLGTVIIAAAFAAVGAGVAVGLMVWEPWDGDGDGGRTGVEPSPIADTPSLQPTDVFDLFIAACLGESANEIIFEEMPRGGRNNRLWGDWLKSSFEYEANGWWRVRPSVGIFWRIHEFTAEVMPAC